MVSIVDTIVALLKQNGAEDIKVILNDFNTVYEQQSRITWVFNGRACEMIFGLVRPQGSDGH
jgi:hypothetical protein